MKQLHSISRNAVSVKGLPAAKPSQRILPHEAHAVLAMLEGWAETSAVAEGALLAR